MAIGETTGSAATGGTGDPSARRGAATETGQDMQQAAVGVKDEAMAAAGRVSDAARDRARQVLGRQQHLVADQIDGVAHAFRRVADDLQEEEMALPARYVARLADRAEDFAEGLRNRGLEDLSHEIEDFAHRQPELFIGAAMVAGIAVGRFLKASGERRRAQRLRSRGIGAGQGQGGTYAGGQYGDDDEVYGLQADADDYGDDTLAGSRGYRSAGYTSSSEAGRRGRIANPTRGDDAGRYGPSGGMDERGRRLHTTGSRADETAHYPNASGLTGATGSGVGAAAGVGISGGGGMGQAAGGGTSSMGAGAGGYGTPPGGTGAGGLGDTGSGRSGAPGVGTTGDDALGTHGVGGSTTADTAKTGREPGSTAKPGSRTP